jgi:hypothetical protein
MTAKNGGSSRVRLGRPLFLTEALSRREQVVRLGGPGSAKNSLLRYLTVALAQPAPVALPSGWGAGYLLDISNSIALPGGRGLAVCRPAALDMPYRRA